MMLIFQFNVNIKCWRSGNIFVYSWIQMDNLTICDIFVHEKKVFSQNLNYLKHVITHITLNGVILVRVHDSRSHGETIRSAELRYWRHKVKAITYAHLIAAAEALKEKMQFYSVHWLFCGKLMTRKKKEKLKKRKGWSVRPRIGRRQQFGALHAM